MRPRLQHADQALPARPVLPVNGAQSAPRQWQAVRVAVCRHTDLPAQLCVSLPAAFLPPHMSLLFHVCLTNYQKLFRALEEHLKASAGNTLAAAPLFVRGLCVHCRMTRSVGGHTRLNQDA